MHLCLIILLGSNMSENFYWTLESFYPKNYMHISITYHKIWQPECKLIKMYICNIGRYHDIVEHETRSLQYGEIMVKLNNFYICIYDNTEFNSIISSLSSDIYKFVFFKFKITWHETRPNADLNANGKKYYFTVFWYRINH